jgi:hypothetical protein
MTTQDRDTRDQLLDELKAAVEHWHERRTKQIRDEADFLKSVLRGRTGSERLRRSSVTRARVLVLDDITSFLAGGS